MKVSADVARLQSIAAPLPTGSAGHPVEAASSEGAGARWDSLLNLFCKVTTVTFQYSPPRDAALNVGSVAKSGHHFGQVRP